MDKKQLATEYMSILTESHPGLTFEEYRDCCVFLLFYKYCCLKYGDFLDDQYKLKELVRLAIRGKLQIPLFLRFMESASSFLHLAGSPIRLMDLSFGLMLKELHSQEKEKSLARFIRKLIKKIDAWDCDEILFEESSRLFTNLMTGFARSRKETHLSEMLLSLYHMFFEIDTEGGKKTGRVAETVFVPEFRYGLLFGAMQIEDEPLSLLGYDSGKEYLEICRIICFMKGLDPEKYHFYDKPAWAEANNPFESVDRIGVFMPEGPGANELVAEPEKLPWDRELFSSRSKGELPFVLSALPYLKKNGRMVIVFPSALLYREGKETQIRKYLIENLNCLDAVVLLPDSLFVSAGQQEVLLYFKMGRKSKNIMFFDCSDISRFGEEDLDKLREGMKSRKPSAGYSACAMPEDLSANDYNLNLPRYISRTEAELTLDLDARRERIREIDAELKEIDDKIIMYKRALEIL